MFSLRNKTGFRATVLSGALMGALAGGMYLMPQRSAADNAPATQPVAALDDEYVMTKSRVQTMPAMNVLYLTSETTIAQIGDSIRAAMQTFGDAERAGKFRPRAAPIFIFHGMTPDPSKKFEIEVVFPVADDVKAFDDFQVKKLESFKCAALVYAGPMKDIAQAFAAVYEDVATAGLQPTEEIREEQLKFEDSSSPNNVVMVEVGVQ